MTQETSAALDPRLLGAVDWRCIGPPRGGRVLAVAGDPVDQATFYFGAVAGGVWKTDDAGLYWQNISDGYLNTSSVGAIAVSDSDPNVIYAGTGEACLRLDITHGDGVYRSTDRGNTWTHLGLEDTRHIGRVRIHPNNPDIVYVAALGHAFGPNKQRGVFRTTDGGKTWEHVLFKSENAGAVDLSMDPSNPRILYASIWQVRRNFWNLENGGPESGLYRSTDGGDTWTEITNNPGMPGGIKGRIGVAVSPAKSGRVWASVDAEDCGVYRSDDGGDTWELLTGERDLQGRPWYYSHIFADPQDAETAWIMNFKAWKSVDGGRNFTEIGIPHGDNHDIWIDPRKHAAHGAGQRRRGVRESERRRLVVDHLQPADVAVLPPDDRQRVSLQGVRHSAGQRGHQRALTKPQDGDTLGRLLLGRHLGERAHRGRSQGLQRDHIGRDRELAGRRREPPALRPLHGADAPDNRVAGAILRLPAPSI